MKHIVDVREPLEFKMGHVAGSTNIPLSRISRIPEDFEKDDEIIIYCQSGHRAGMAVEIFKKHGYINVVNGINKQYVEQNYL